MIEPPRQAIIGAVLEIDYRILVAIELFSIECVACPVHRRRIGDLRIRVNFCEIELGKYRGRRDSVETIAVIKYPQIHKIQIRPWAKHSRLESEPSSVKNDIDEHQAGKKRRHPGARWI